MKLRLAPLITALALSLPLHGCGDDGTDNVVSDSDGGTEPGCEPNCVDFSDASPLAPDAGPNTGCVPGGVQCNNCVDDDEDGLTDGFDPECTSSADDDEGSFGTGISGDNVDAKTQDCFFDGNSGGGDDKCKFHTCCLLTTECPEELQPPKFDPAECVSSQACIDNCAPLTPPGCDCYGCCTVCNDQGCFDIITNPAVAPDCSQETVQDEALCPRCNKSPDCNGGGCTELECTLCPGQTEEDLPDECGGQTECPSGQTSCSSNSDCLSGQFCASGCCIDGID